MKLVLHGYFRSGTSYRTRLALNWKGVEYQYVAVNLATGEQHSDAYKSLNPQGLVPALEVDGQVLTQSVSILEWIEETFPERPLLPTAPIERARVRAFAAAIGCDIHPLQNLRILKKARELSGDDAEAGPAWARHWISVGFDALEQLADQADGQNGFIFGDGPTLAEIYLLPQMFNARRFGVDLTAYPRLVAADEAARALPDFERAAPENQPDAV
ncbi:Maleylpyruvate isomerase [Oceanicaulis sp. 350]|nr:Maleylpyruvate isomerase [Oceanicaulis sp. 350]